MSMGMGISKPTLGLQRGALRASNVFQNRLGKVGLFSQTLKLGRRLNSHAHIDCFVIVFTSSSMRVSFLTHDSQRISKV